MRSFAVTDFLHGISCDAKRNRVVILLYVLSCVVFLIIGITVGVGIEDKNDYITRNGAVVFSFLRGDTNAFMFFFKDFIFNLLYALFAASMFFWRFLPLLSFAPCLYLSYALGLRVTVIISVYSAASLPMLFVLYVPMCIVQIVFMCVISKKCFEFAAMNNRCKPSKREVKDYYFSLLPCFITILVSSALKAITAVFFGSALIGIV